jgi:hypothetical protein
MTRNARLSAALALADAGRHVFLLGRSKRPIANCPACRTAGPNHNCGCLTCHGFYAATRDPDRIAAMLAAHPSGLLAVRTGAPSGVVVVDIDPRHGGRVDPDLMPPTACVRTGSGGWHLYYRHPGQPVPSRPLPGRAGVDIKGDGGYVVAPPSAHPDTGRPYVWVRREPIEEMPPALRAAVLTPPASRAPAPPTGRHHPITTRAAGGISYPDRLLAAHLDAVRRAPVGRRRVTLYGAARGVARMVAAGAISHADAWAALTEVGRHADQTERDIRAAIAGGFQAEGVAA